MILWCQFVLIWCICYLQGVHLAQLFEQLVGSDERFEIPVERHLGMVVFRLKGENEMTEKLLKKLNGSGEQEYEFTSKIYFNIFSMDSNKV